jgi:hypothetical protein
MKTTLACEYAKCKNRSGDFRIVIAPWRSGYRYDA